MAGYTANALSTDWCTEDRICERLPRVFGDRPALDPCSNPYSRVNAKVEYTLEKGYDGLVDPWGKTNFVNPPFGRAWWRLKPDGRREYMWPSEREALANKLEKGELTKAELKAILDQYTPVSIADWIKRAADIGEQGNPTIGLIPAYPGTKAWQKDVWARASAICFPEGRLHFRLVSKLEDGTVVEKTGPAPMDCALPLWKSEWHDHDVLERFVKVFGEIGHVVIG